MSAASASSSSAASSSATSSQQPARSHDAPPANRVHLHRHALESIFACLDIAGLATAMRVSRDWQAAVGSMRSIDASWTVVPGFLPSLQPIVSSRLRRHVSGIDFNTSFPLQIELAPLHEHMPHVTRISGLGAFVFGGVSSLLWPARLQELKLQNIQIDAKKQNSLLRSIGRCAELRTLELDLKHTKKISFAPLAALSALRVLRLTWTNEECPKLNDAQVDQLRALVNLEELSTTLTAASAVRLIRLPHDLRWKQTPHILEPDDTVCALLPGLRCLTRLSVMDSVCTDFSWLQSTSCLVQLEVGFSEDHLSAEAAAESLMIGLQHCSALRSLTLSAQRMPITPDHLAECLGSMPLLNSLDIWYARLPSLSFLAVPSLGDSLRTLALHHFLRPRPDASEIRHLRGLKSLHSLLLEGIFADTVDESIRADFQPPSALLPKLEAFFCVDAQESDDDDDDDVEEYDSEEEDSEEEADEEYEDSEEEDSDAEEA